MKNIFRKIEKPASFLLLQLCGYLLHSSPFGWWRRRTFVPGKLQKVLINMSRPGMGMGDLIQITPLVQALCKVSPEIQISLLVSGARCPEITSLFPAQVEIITMPVNFYFYGHRQWLSFVLKHIRSKQFDLIIHQYLEYWLSVSYVSIFSKSRWIISYANHVGRKAVIPNKIGTFLLRKSPPDELPFFYNEELAECLQYSGSWKTSLKVEGNTLRNSEKILSNFGINSNDLILGIHPGCTSSHLFRRWPADNFIATARQFCEGFNAKVIVFGGPDEEAEVLKIQLQLHDVNAGIAAGHIEEVAALIKRCSIFLTNDSGFMHISQAVGVPTVAIYGPTKPEKFDNLYTNSHFVRLRGNIPCEPCLGTKRAKECGSNVPKCITAVTVEQAYAALKGLLINAGFMKGENVCHPL